MPYFLIDKREIPNARLGEAKATLAECNAVAPDFEWVEVADPSVAAESHYWDGTAAVANPPPPSAPVVWSALEFMERFTKQERNNIRAAAKQNADLEDWLDLLRAAGEVNPEDQRTIDGLAALVAAGLLTQQRADAIVGA